MESEHLLEKLWSTNSQSKAEKKYFAERALAKLVSKNLPLHLFNLLQGYLPLCDLDGSTVLCLDKLDSSSLQALIHTHSACAIHIRGFCPTDIADRLSTHALSEFTQWKIHGKITTDMFYAGGSIPNEVAKRSWPEFKRYFSERDDFINSQRKLSGGNWPADRLEAELRETWPGGAVIGRWLGHKMRPAMMRVMQGGVNDMLASPAHGLGYIHTDGSFYLRPSYGMFSANIYLKLPEEGGALCVWGVNLGSERNWHDYLRNRLLLLLSDHFFDPEWQIKLRRLLPAPYIIRPEPGDLIIINSGRLHSVVPLNCGNRVTIQTFISASGAGPLAIFS
jgi:hypothetical protein